MTEGLIRRERGRKREVTSERVTAAGNGKQLQRSGASIGRREEINLIIYSDLKEETCNTLATTAEGFTAE
ncbi:hypothetical protein ABVT39_023332 [Epinephelus coioides]